MVLKTGSTIPVPESLNYPAGEFCVMKYEAKDVNGTAESQASGEPWILTMSEAGTMCNSLGQGFGLINNLQWMSIATDIAEVPANWTSNIVGTGTLIRGHTDNAPSKVCPASQNDKDAFFEGAFCLGLAAGDTPEQRRTHFLSNDSVVWDLSGNAMEWVNLSIDSRDQPIGTRYNHVEYINVSGTAVMPLTDLIPQIAIDNVWDSNYGIGKYKQGDQFRERLKRGGWYDEFTNAGIFSADFGSKQNVNHTFRCTITVPTND